MKTLTENQLKASNARNFHKKSRVIEEDAAGIVTIRRGRDNAVLYIGQHTCSGKIESFQIDENAVGGMSAKMAGGGYVAVPCITLHGECLREHLVEKIIALRVEHNNFNQGAMRWKGKKFKDTPIQDVNINNLTDLQLLEFYEMIYRQHLKQM